MPDDSAPGQVKVSPRSGWYIDPDDPEKQRYWSGGDWRGKPRRDMAAMAKPFPGVRFITQEEAAARQAARAGASPATTEALEELAYWSQRASFLTHLAAEAQQRLAEARSEAKALGIPKEQARTWRPPAASIGARRGGFAFFYAESGLDLDGNGLVDGGLFESLGDLL